MHAKKKWGDRMDSLFQKHEEKMELVRSILTVILDDDTMAAPTWSSLSLWYYTKLARRILAERLDIIDDIESLAARVRGSYRTFLEHQHHVLAVPLERQGFCVDRDDDCACCLKPLKGPRKIARLRTPDDDPEKCAHVFHLECALHIEPDPSGVIKCPLCRAVIGPVMRTWLDTENAVPEF